MFQDKIDDIGFCFDNTYTGLPKALMSGVSPQPVKSPEMLIVNRSFAKSLDLNFSKVEDSLLAQIFSGNNLCNNSKTIAQAYAGHQFGFFTNLGDGRAVLLGEHKTKKQKRFDIQLKGSGKTPYSRQGDGRAALGPVLREYLVSEAMFCLGVPTTRGLAVVKTGEDVMRENPLPGAILTRVASSHIRIGTFQFAAAKKDLQTLGALMKYTIKRHFAELIDSKNPALDLLKSVTTKQTNLVINWMRVGFVHGVMNTDNVAVSGETIDYGPCAFLDSYSREAVFSSIDYAGRYSFGNQPIITHWNLLRFAETLLPLIDKNQKTAVEMVTDVFSDFDSMFKKKWFSMMFKKVGLSGKYDDEVLVKRLLAWMEKSGADYTNTFCDISTKKDFYEKEYLHEDFVSWIKDWKKRLDELKKEGFNSFRLMQKNNPVIIPRNQMVESVLYEAVTNNNINPFIDFVNVLKKPYDVKWFSSKYQAVPGNGGLGYKTFCGT